MSFYPAQINEKLKNAAHTGILPQANAVGTSAAFTCGTFVRFFLQIDVNGKQITGARFKTSGCGFLIAAAEVLCEQIKNKELVGLHGFDKSFLKERIEDELGEFPAHRQHCLDVCLNALQKTFADFRTAQIEEWSGEKVLICTCFGIPAETIEGLIVEKSLETVEEVTENCRAGGGCGACQPLIQEILDGHDFG